MAGKETGYHSKSGHITVGGKTYDIQVWSYPRDDTMYVRITGNECGSKKGLSFSDHNSDFTNAQLAALGQHLDAGAKLTTTEVNKLKPIVNICKVDHATLGP